MKTKLRDAGIIIVLILSLSLAPSAFAVEGGMQRPISGMQIAPFAGVIPPEPGFDVVVSEIYYSGSIGGAANVAIGGLFVANVDVKASFTPITLLYIWPTPTKEWNFASAVGFSTGVDRMRGQRFPWPVHGPEKRQHLRTVRFGFYPGHSKPSL
jgi:hypothetical protein